MNQIRNSIERLGRRMLLSIGHGEITHVDDSSTTQKIQASLNQLETQDNIPRVAEYGLTSSPPIGSDVALVFVGGDRSNGIAVGTNHQSSRPTGLASGETMLYQQNGIQVYLSNAGVVVNAAGLSVTVNDATTVTINASAEIALISQTKVAITAPLISMNGS